MSNKTVPIVILNWNKRDDTLACIESVYKLTYEPKEIVVVDNGSTDNSVGAIKEKFPDVHLIRNEENEGVCVGRNLGLDYVKKNFDCDYILFLDNDTILHKGYLTLLTESMKEDKTAGLSMGKAYGKYPTDTLMSTGIVINLWTGIIRDRGVGEKDVGQYNNVGYIDSAPGFGNLFRAQDLYEVNGWNLEYSPYGWDDTELCLRIRRNGHNVLYNPKAVIYHSGTQAGRAPIFGYERNKIKNYFRLLNDFANPLQMITIAILLPFRWIALIVRHIRNGHTNIVVAQFSGLFDWLFKKTPIIRKDNTRKQESVG